MEAVFFTGVGFLVTINGIIAVGIFVERRKPI